MAAVIGFRCGPVPERVSTQSEVHHSLCDRPQLVLRLRAQERIVSNAAPSESDPIRHDSIQGLHPGRGISDPQMHARRRDRPSAENNAAELTAHSHDAAAG